MIKKHKNKYKYEVFISHASKDKARYVTELVKELKILNIKLFYDDDVFTIGDEIDSVIDYGLNNSLLAVVVISKNFSKRYWTKYELLKLLIRQNNEKTKIILPILLNISKKTFVKNYPELKNIHFKFAKSMSKKEMALLIKKEVDNR